MHRVGTWWLHTRSALRLAGLATSRFAFRVREGLLFSFATALLTFLVSRNLGTAAFGLLSFPIAVAVVFMWQSARNLGGWNSLYAGEYRQQFGQGEKRLYLNSVMGDGFYALGIRCIVQEPGGLTSTAEREHNINGWTFPREFPELSPPAPGRHHAVWQERSHSGRWWTLATFDFDVPEGVQP